jgi:hypothetical protein
MHFAGLQDVNLPIPIEEQNSPNRDHSSARPDRMSAMRAAAAGWGYTA